MSFFDTIANAFSELKAGSTNLLTSPTDTSTPARVDGPFGMSQVAPAKPIDLNAAKAKGAETLSGVNNFAKTISNGMASYALGAGESIPRLAAGAYSLATGNKKAGEIATAVVPPTTFPTILGKWLGPLQSPQSKVNANINAGMDTTKAVTGGIIDQALNNPAGTEIGLALKPFGLALGAIAPKLMESLGFGKGVVDTIAKETDPKVISTMLPDNIPNKDALAQKLSTASDKGTVEKIIDDHIKTENPALLGKDGGTPSVSQIEASANDYRQTGKVVDNGMGETANLDKGGKSTEVPQLPKFLKEETSAYNKKLYNTPDNQSILENAAQTGDDIPTTSRVAKSLSDTKTNLLEYVQNTDERVRQLIDNPAAVVDDSSNIYQKLTLYSGKVGKLIEDGRVATETAVKDMKVIADEIKTDLAATRKEVNDYLIARHAPERNASLGEGAAGITTKEAEERLAKIESSPQGAKIKAVADKIQDLNNKTLDMLRESGVITDDLYKTLREKYKNHVPLQRIFEGENDIGSVLGGAGLDVKSTGIKRAKGSQREVADVLGNVITNYEQAALRSQKNIVDNATLNFVRNNQDLVGDQMTIIKPKIVGKGNDGRAILEQTQDPHILQMYEDGKKVWIKIEDPNMAIALRGVGREKLGGFLNAVGTFTRLYSGLMTRFDPISFALPNKIRDLQEVITYLASQKDIGVKGSAKVLKHDAQSFKDVMDSLRGKDTAGAKLYAEMRDMGGTTGGMGLSTRKETELNLAKLEKIANSKTRQVGEKLVEYVDNINAVFEDSTRLSVYKTALENGLSKDRAAFLAKEASINFNRMGKGGPLLNALYMFSNASIQGTTKMMRALKNPKVLGSVMLAVGGATASVNEWNDRVDPNWRNKVTKYDRLNGLPIVLPNKEGGVHYVTIPISWGLKPIKVMSDYAYDATAGQGFDAKNFVNDIMVSMVNAYNPVGGTDLTSALVPTILDTPVEVQRNQSWNGSKIRSDTNQNAPKDIQYFSSLGNTKEGKIAISISEILKDKADVAISPADIKYYFDQYIGGAGRTVGKFFNMGAAFNSKEPLPASEYPLISRFYKSRTEEEVGQGAGAKTSEIKTLLENQARESFRRKNDAETLYKKLSGMPKEQANAKAEELRKTDPLLFAKLKQIAVDEKKGLNYQERLMGQLGVANGERAKYIFNNVMTLGSKEEKNAYISNLQSKGLASKEVIAQLRALIKQKP